MPSASQDPQTGGVVDFVQQPLNVARFTTDTQRTEYLDISAVAGEQPNYSPETIDTAWHAITPRRSPSASVR